MAYKRPDPTPGHPVARGGRPYIWATWLSKLLGGDQCVRAVWFKSRYQYAKVPEKNAEQLQEWNRAHNQMMRERRAALEENGWRVQTEQEFKLEGQTAVIAGKEDLVAEMPGHVLIVDGKTGRRRESDFWQVLIYLYARLHQRPLDANAPPIKLAGEVFYKSGKPVGLTVSDVERHEPTLVQMVQAIAGETEPTPNPSRHECGRCNIRREDCSQRFADDREREPVTTGAF